MTSEKPIIFSGPMVQAILAGRKTQTRRVIKPQPTGNDCFGICTDSTDGKNIGKVGFGSGQQVTDYVKPRYKTGDTLWVRETWPPFKDYVNGEAVNRFAYKADGKNYCLCACEGNNVSIPVTGWKPSIYMPREAARIFLKLTGVRAERVQNILYSDMRAEGVIPELVKGGRRRQWQDDYFKPLWNKLNEKRGYGWNKNPWVWVYEFEKI